jgi:alpha-1,6-mannosyltransferase
VKICDVTDAYHPTSGGIRTYIDEKIRFIRSATDFEHILVIPAERDFAIEEGRTRVFGVASPVIPGCAPYRVLWRYGRLTRILDRVRPDVIELGNPYFQPRAARAFRRRYGGTLAGFYHTDFPRAYVETPLRRLMGRRPARRAAKSASRFARYVHSNLDLTVVSSRALRRKLTWMGIPRVELVPLGVDATMFHPDRRDLAWRRTLGVGDEDVLLMFVGRLDAEKRIDVLLGMTAKLPPDLPWKLLILGNGAPRRLVERAAAQDPRIRYLPYERDRATLARCLASADVYVSAARFETFGLAVLEAQASGLPVVGQRAGAMVDRVPESTGILVPTFGPESMAGAVVQLLQGDFRARGRDARALVESRHSWPRTFNRLFELYEGARRAGIRREVE